MRNRNLVIIFIKNPVSGKVKTRLASTIGNENALVIYQLLLRHTLEITKNLNCDKVVFYSDKIIIDDEWSSAGYFQQLQQGADLGERMSNAFEAAFNKGYERVIIIGSDCFELKQEIIEEAINKLEECEIVLGSARDGGYYLLGLRQMMNELFIHKSWGTSTVLDSTLNDIYLSHKTFFLLQVLNDVDEKKDVPPELLKKTNAFMQ